MNKFEVVLLLGLFKGSRFSYARALVTEDINTSFIDVSIAEDLKCFENVESLKEVEVSVGGVWSYAIFSLCVIDKVAFNGYEIPYQTVVHVAKPLRRNPLYEAYVGRDLINYWQLYVNSARGIVRSRIAKKVKLA
ncbi:MAG: hypothetical protein RMH84_01255 [Sulfolobales archaeon]|nr:hypothetical protein [Sulfolobales archaeon]MCX8208038.1 hypothetical protein [Sulfolobales archaeon]MDW8010213.1 hypothetical protein [Sulfolobales archaeon]